MKSRLMRLLKMHPKKLVIFFSILTLTLLIGCEFITPPSAFSFHLSNKKSIGFIQPFLISFNRAKVLTIGFISGHPEYDAVEASVTNRVGQEPLINVIITLLDGTQVDHINDEEVAKVRAQTTCRYTVFSPMQYQETQVDGVPSVFLQFTSFKGEDVVFDFHALFPPSTEYGGLIDPEGHAPTSALPVMWGNASTLSSLETLLIIDGVNYSLQPGPFPNSLKAFYTDEFLIGVIRKCFVYLQCIYAPNEINIGEEWVYMDHLSNLYKYKIVQINGDEIVIHKTTGPEEIITAQLTKRRLRIISIRATGRINADNDFPPTSIGFKIDLTEPDQFKFSIDENEGLITGMSKVKKSSHRLFWSLIPSQPDWALTREVQAFVYRHGNNYCIINTICTGQKSDFNDQKKKINKKPKPKKGWNK